MKRLFISLIFIILSLPLFAFTLQGGITYTVNSARLESFNDVKYKIDVSNKTIEEIVKEIIKVGDEND